MSKAILDDFEIDFGDLRALIDAAYDVLRDMPYERDGKRDTELDRVASIIRVAQYFSGQIELSIAGTPRLGGAK
ncbi:hypothetical protein C5748_25740 [Phyllobacterium phragmitis]|uniref:Uncharacterized protein n=1 Tax=Phyllobacterium phragmitis TaxID=2670329 RepID=A0A2S9IJG4_9HYPH|nr:hypothetical protein [Phyllobacterium phragmitis]PRD40670.1 hypothetical protein C5748_25740 [Phyllobacterium phragmitis]